MMDELQYKSLKGQKHRAVSQTETIKLISSAKGLTVYTLNDLLNSLNSKRVKSLIDSQAIHGEVLHGITAGRAPQVLTTNGKLDIESVTQLMVLGYALWYLRQLNLLTGAVQLDDGMLTTTVVVDDTAPFTKPSLVLPLRLMFWRQALDKQLHEAQITGHLPIVVCQSWQEVKDTFNQLSEAAKSNGVLAVYCRQQQNAKWLSGYWLRPDGAIPLTGMSDEHLLETFKSLHATPDDRLLTEVMDSYDRSAKLRQVHLPSLRKTGGE